VADHGDLRARAASVFERLRSDRANKAGDATDSVPVPEQAQGAPSTTTLDPDREDAQQAGSLGESSAEDAAVRSQPNAGVYAESPGAEPQTDPPEARSATEISDAGEVGAGEVGPGEVGVGEVDAGDVDAGEVGVGDVDAGEVGAGEVGAGEVGAGEDDQRLEGSRGASARSPSGFSRSGSKGPADPPPVLAPQRPPSAVSPRTDTEAQAALSARVDAEAQAAPTQTGAQTSAGIKTGAEDPVPAAPERLTEEEISDLGSATATTAGLVHPAAAIHPLPRCFAIANQKGGVGKTTTAVNLGAALAELGFRVLVVDLDPQGNATTGLGVNPRNLDSSTYNALLHEVALEDIIEPTALRNLFVVPSTINLAGAEIELVPQLSRELKLRRALEPVRGDFDFTLIDCPPSLGLLTVNGLAAASEVIVPIQCEYYALEGLGQLLRNVGLVQANLNPELEVSTIILTMYDARTRLAEQVMEEVKAHFGDKVCRTVVPRTVRLSEAPSFGQPIIIFDPSSRGAIAYRELAREVSGGTPQRSG
jgi:chromosome partitioning protein